MIGEVISHYKILGKLGQGAMGVIYKAQDLKLDRLVALKFLPAHLDLKDSHKKRFALEAKAASGLDHANICTIYEIGETKPVTGEPGRQMFIAMAHYDGESLRDKLKGGPLPVAEALDIATQIAEGLAKAHSRDIIHRDIKPANIMVTDEGVVKIVDFGLAKISGVKITKTDSTLGTMAYMAPEQMRGETVDRRADIWSWGVLFYEMLAGELPFAAEHETEIMYRVLNEDKTPIAELCPELSPAIARVIDKALEKEPEERYHQMADAIADLKGEQNESAPTSRTAVRAKKNKPIRLRIVWASAVFVLILLAAFLIGRLQTGTAPAKPVSHKQITFHGNIPIGGESQDLSAISPDGQFLAYPLPKKGGQSVMLQDLTGGRPVEVYRGFQFLGFLRWSPDGSRLLLGGRDKGPDRSFSLIIPRFGGKPQTLPSATFVSCWSPDGRRIAGARVTRESITFYNTATGDTTGVIRLHDSPQFADLDWAPVGDRIVFLTNDENETLHTIWTVQTDGTRQQKIVEEETSRLYSPRWSHDGHAIYYLRDHGQTQDLMKIAVSTSDGTPVGDAKVLQSGLHAFGFTLSRDNRKLSYTNYLAYTNLWLVSRAGEKIETKKLTQGTRSFRDCSIAPDGKKIAFGHGPNIFVLPITGGEMQQLTFFKSESYKGQTYPTYDICWSPDGTELAFFLDEKVWLVPANGGPVRPFGNTDSAGDLAWAPHSEILYRRVGNRNAHFLNPLTREERPLLTNDSLGWIFKPTYSPDSRNVAVYWSRKKENEFDGLWVISLTDSSQTLLWKGPFWPIEWAEDGKWIYAIKQEESPAKIYMIPMDGGQAKILCTLPFEKIKHGGFVGTISMTRDGKHIVCNVEETQSDVWLMENFDPEL